ncbi:MAG TPA: nucleotidyltransferase family protein [Burkholderiales bacterium]|nr:nucleotidyltransferase family protein [Burkholderiales bacterium]
MKAMILAAGRGERMRPLTDRIPKPLLSVAGKPLVVWLLERLVRGGFSEIVVNVSHLGELIEAALGDGGAYGARIAYSREREPLETAGGIAAALPLLGAEPFAVVNGDIHTDFEFGQLATRAAAFPRLSALAHLVLVDNPAHHPRGDFALNEGRIDDGPGPRLTFSGIGIYDPGLFARITPGSKYQLATLLRGPIAARQVTAERYAGDWTDVGTPERLAALEGRLAGGAGIGR